MWEKFYIFSCGSGNAGVKVEKHEKEIDVLKAENRELAAIVHEILPNFAAFRSSANQTGGKYLCLLKIDYLNFNAVCRWEKMIKKLNLTDKI